MQVELIYVPKFKILYFISEKHNGFTNLNFFCFYVKFPTDMLISQG